MKRGREADAGLSLESDVKTECMAQLDLRLLKSFYLDSTCTNILRIDSTKISITNKFDL